MDKASSEDAASYMQRLELKGVKGTGQDLGQGCYYAQTTEVLYRGLKCSARKINLDLIREQTTENGDDSKVVERFAKYCAVLSELRHPHVIQFMGIYQDSEKTFIISECLPATLDTVLERYGCLPEELSHSILQDVALGLTYLHGLNPPVNHGELVASNVLLSWDMSAKLSDVGVATLLGLGPEQRRNIGKYALAHLPPEALAMSASRRVYSNKKTDSYSYGVLMIHTLSSEFPEYIARKAERTRTYSMGSDADLNGIEDILEGVHTDHPLSSLILQCISWAADLRPEASQILSTISEMMLQFPAPSFERRVQILQRVLKITHERKASGQRDTIVRKDSIANLANSIEIEHLKLQIDELQVENRGLRTSLSKQQKFVSARDHEMAAKLMAKDQEILAKQQELFAQEAAIDASKATVSAKEATINGLTNQLKHLQGYLATKHEVSACWL